MFSVDCFDYRSNIVKDTMYRKLFVRNYLPNIYNGLMYFRRSKEAQKFYKIAESIVQNWQQVKSQILVACHDEYPSTDVVFALAYRIMDPTARDLIDYDWFKFIHNKADVHGLSRFANHNDYLMPNISEDKIYVGETRVSRVWHYHDKELHARNI